MKNTNMTYDQALNIALTAIADNAEAVQKLTALKEQIIKRNSAKRRPTKAQRQNLELSEVVREVLQNASEPLTVSEIMARSDVLAVLTNQKVSAVVRSMGADVVKTVDKRVSKYSLAV